MTRSVSACLTVVVLLASVLLLSATFDGKCAVVGGAAEQAGSPVQAVPAVTAPPEAFFERFKEKDREAARAFYKKHMDVGGLSIAAAPTPVTKTSACAAPVVWTSPASARRTC